jgi:hypothetical protein
MPLQLYLKIIQKPRTVLTTVRIIATDEVLPFSCRRDRRQSSPSLASNARFPKLSTLNLSLTQITDKFFRACADTAPSLLANLTSLDTTGCLRVSDLSVKILATRCQALRTLNLNGCPRVTNPSSLRSCHDLTRLNLGKTSVTDSRLHRLLSERMSKLTDLGSYLSRTDV